MNVLTRGSRRVVVRTRGGTGAAFESSGAAAVLTDAPQDSAEPSTWLAASLDREQHGRLHPWDAAHGVLDAPAAASLEFAGPLDYVEPDFEQQFPYIEPEPETLEAFLDRAETCAPRTPSPHWPTAPGRFAWHLDDDYTQLGSTRDSLGDPGDGARIRVAILDTGYDPAHASLPLHMRHDLERNFTDDGSPDDASDPAASFPLNNPGHGTATLAILAGNQISHGSEFQGLLGGAPFVEVVPTRIADSVVHFRTSAMAHGIEYAAATGCQVASISMGGVPTRLWADAVNKAYEAGMCIFAAAGNRFGPSPPETLVYPARFDRVVGVCGFTSDKTPYFKPGFHLQMHGSFGPPSAMKAAMAAFTPNIPWAKMGCDELVNPDGAGTSSATPQCAAAAALWLQHHRPNPPEKWRIVEAVRHALFSSADRSPSAGTKYFANGLLRAKEALAIGFRSDLPKTPRDRLLFPWLRFLTTIFDAPAGAESARQEMFEMEALQLHVQTPSLQRIAGGADHETDDLGRATLKDYVNQMRRLPNASQTLRRHLDEIAKQL